MVLLFSNERIVRIGSTYYARVINFTDFLIRLSQESSDYHLALSCEVRDAGSSDDPRLTRIDVDSERLLELPNLASRYQSLFHALGIALRIRRYLRDRGGEQPCSVFAPGLNSVCFVLSWLLPRNTRWYLFIRGDTRKTVDEIYQGSLLRPLMTAAIDLFQARVDRLLTSGRAQVFVYGQALREKFYRDFGDRTHVVSPLISNDWLDAAPGTPGFEAARGSLRVLYVGRLSAEKNVAALIEACAVAKYADNAFELTIVGDGPQEKHLTELCARLDVQDIVTFVGRVANGPELRRYYDSHHVFCLPSKTEGTPRAIAEAVARGLPIIAADVGSVRFMFSAGVVSLLQGFEPAHILQALRQLSERYPEVSSAAGRHREEARRYTLDYNVKQILTVVAADGGDAGHA